ncbi:MAG: metallophosphoesterase [Calditrichales bacterium]|nr:MAG: metallophosphoesterase [Calditrichales bacterium]
MKRFLILFSLILVISSCGKQAVQQVKIGMCSDVHLPTMHDSEWRITTFIDSMKMAKPDFIIELGDFGTPAEKYAPYFDIWNAYPGTKYHVIGNHEMDGGYSMEEALAYRNMPSARYTFEQNGFYFIVLNGNDKKDPMEKGYRQYIGPEQQQWLKEKLESATGPVVIFSHQGLGPIDGIDNHAEVRAILEAHNRQSDKNKVIAAFNGHSHNDNAEQINGIWYICINSMAYEWLGEEYGHIRYSEEVDKDFKWIKYTAPYKDPLFTVVEISMDGYIRIAGKKSEWVGPSPWEVGYPEENRPYTVPEIRPRNLHFDTF